jgi:PIN domain nuclease of toxin-antitoxin system
VNLLLDTHIWLWSLLDPDRLGRDVAAALEDRGNACWLSPISTWELLILTSRGRVQLDRDPGVWIREVLAALPFREAPLTHEVALRSRSIELAHDDPADRFLLATALVYELTLVTADERLLESRACPLLASRRD